MSNKSQVPGHRAPSQLNKSNEFDLEKSIPTSESTPRKPYSQYDWINEFEAAEDRAEAAGIMTNSSVDIGRVIEGGRITHTSNLPVNCHRSFIIYDGCDVVAVVEDREKTYPLIYLLAKLHIGRVKGSSHPDDLALDSTQKSLPNYKNDQRWILYFRPKKQGSGAKQVKA